MIYPEGTHCEVRRPVTQNKRQKLSPGTKRTYTPAFQEMLMKAKTIGDIIKAYRKAGATYGIHSDMSPELHAILDKAEKCKEPV
jgi:hypothetical protein